MKKAIIIGAGVAGLATAVRLAVQGLEVSVFEKNAYPGGKLSHFTIGNYHFDAGPSLFTQPENLEELFRIANEDITKYFQYQSLPIACKYFYNDGTVVNAYTALPALKHEIQSRLGEAPEAVEQYLKQSADLYENVGNIFLNHSLHQIKDISWKEIYKAIKTVRLKHLFKSLHKVNLQHFKNPKTVQLFDRYATYNGSNPYKAPGMLSLIPHLEFTQGTYYPKGGMISITNALVALAKKKGVRFYFNQTVTAIQHYKNKITGIVSNNVIHDAEIVVSNMDAVLTYKYLLKQEIKVKQLLKQERSSSALIFYWGIRKNFPQLELHNILFSNNYKAEFDALFLSKNLYSDPTVYINITSKLEPGKQAPVGCENWFVMINAPANVGQHWDDLKQQARKNIIQKINRVLQVDIEQYIEAEQVLDPVLIEEKTASYQGSLYGTSSNSKWAAFLRHPNFSSQLKGLYFVGGSVHPGGGIPLCLKSASIAAQIIQQNNENGSN